MSKAIVCPHCHEKLRMRPSAAPRVRCKNCGKGFDNPNATIVPVQLLTRPLVAPSPTPEPKPKPKPEPDDLFSALNVETEPEARFSIPEPDLAGAPASVAPRQPFVPDPILTIPKKRGAGRAAAARERLRARQAAKTQVRDYVIASVVLVGIAALIVGGFYLVLRDDSPTRAGGDESPAPAPPPAPITSALVETPVQPLPPRLLGVWELRADEDRTGTMDFRTDGTAQTRAIAGDSAPVTEYFYCSLVGETKDEVTIEMGAAPNTPGNFRMRFAFTSPDAFTIVWTIRAGIENTTTNRFVRRGSERTTPSPQP